MTRKTLEKEIFDLIPQEYRGGLVGRELFFKCPNPKHEDHNYTNCSINLDTGLFHCFACGYSGNFEKLKKLLAKRRTNNWEIDPWTGKKINKKRTFQWR